MTTSTSFFTRILSGNCDGNNEADKFAKWIKTNYPNAQTEVLHDTSGTSGGTWIDGEDEENKECHDFLWTGFCNV